MFTEGTRVEFAPGDRICIVGSLPQKGQRGAVACRTAHDPHAYLVLLDQPQGEALFFADELARDTPPSSGQPRA